MQPDIIRRQHLSYEGTCQLQSQTPCPGEVSLKAATYHAVKNQAIMMEFAAMKDEQTGELAKAMRPRSSAVVNDLRQGKATTGKHKPGNEN